MSLALPRRRVSFALALAACVPGAAMALPAGAAREALVIGNSAYPEVPLRNPGRDAAGVDQALRALGFHTQLLRDAGWRVMIESVRAFIARTDGAAVRLIYYAGHGAQVRGRNYLVPVDASMDGVDELIARSLDANEVLERLSREGRGLNIVILDACRDNPAGRYRLLADGRRVKVRGAVRGLVAMRPPAGTLVAFSTSPGSTADDAGGGDNSLYTRHLLKHLATPGLSLEQMFKRVRSGVLQESAQRQRPWEESSLTVDYCLAGC
jgi:uncharacterized caspase-like protein